MANMWNFSERASTSPTLEEMAQKFHNTLNELTILNPSIDNQSGQGVVKRNQAKQTQKKEASLPSSPAPDFSSNEELNHSDNGRPVLNEPEPEPEPEAVPKQRPLSENEEPQQSHETDEISYLDSTLVAENTDLKVYIVKTHFRKMKNFM